MFSPSSFGLLFVIFAFLAISHPIVHGISEGFLGRRPSSGFGFALGYGFGFAYSPLDQYLTINLANFSHWLTTKDVPHGDMDSLSITNFSDVLIRNRFYNLDLKFQDTQITGFASKVRANCIQSDLEGGKISVGYSAYNVTLSGTYTGNGTILNGTSFRGAGNWSLGLQLGCLIETYFNYGNGSHIRLEGGQGGGADGPASKYFRFHCGSTNYAQDGTLNPYPPRSYYNGINNGIPVNTCEYRSRSRILYSRFEGLFNKTKGQVKGQGEDLSGAESLIEVSLTQYLHSYGRQYGGVLRNRMGPLLYQQLAQVIQEKSVFEMLNFDVHKYYADHGHGSVIFVAF